MSDLSYANLMLFHKNIQIGKILPEYGELKTHVDDKGLFIVAKIRSDTEISNDIWQQIIDGEINGFSIGCEVLDSHDRCDADGKNCIEVLDKINIFEVSLTNFPANEMSGFVVISKSKYDEGNLDFKSYENVCDECGINKDRMSKKKVKAEAKEEEEVKEESSEAVEEQEKSEEVELSVEDRIEKLERAILNMEAALTKLSPQEEEKSDDEVSEEPKEETEEKTEEESKEEEKSEEVKEETSELDELRKSVNDISEHLNVAVEKLNGLFTEKSEGDDIEELKLAIKARDDQIDALNKKIEVLTKSEKEEKESKTLKEEEDDESVDLVLDDPFVSDHGEVYLRY